MSTLYKIESLEDEAAKNIAMVINKNGGRCVVAGRAVITDHCFVVDEVNEVIPLIAKTCDQISEWDYQQFNSL
ncbi:hypothetical protein [Vibrio metschnikovii]|uniref:hypothetical protein n=1 Tax=Vibrio metschnikovii TaxID=28172 RepID=UPI00165D8C5C|nr:hypothetical protein [Vibrio metschnikovii]